MKKVSSYLAFTTAAIVAAIAFALWPWPFQETVFDSAKATGLVEVLAIIGATYYAAANIREFERTRSDAVAEKAQQRDQESDRAYQLVWAEGFRIDDLSNRWEQEDLVLLSVNGLLDPQQVLPIDTTALMEACTRCSREAGYLGGMAITMMRTCATTIEALNKVVDEARTPYSGPAQVAGNAGQPARTFEVSTKAALREIARLLDDTAMQAPLFEKPRQIEFRGELKSALARKTAAELPLLQAERDKKRLKKG